MRATTMVIDKGGGASWRSTRTSCVGACLVNQLVGFTVAELSVIVPTFNEADNVPELVTRLGKALEDYDAEVVFVDDSSDHTPEVIR